MDKINSRSGDQENLDFEFFVNKEDEKKRLDLYISEKKAVSRSHAAKLISQGCIKVNDQVLKASYKIKNLDSIRGWIPQIQPLLVEPENLPLDILFEDEHLAVINKAPGMVVHPAPGHENGTLVNAALYHFENISSHGGDNRPGIVHRLDKDTSGAIIVAKTIKAHEGLSLSFRERTIQKKYYAVVFGSPDDTGKIDKPISRHVRDRKKMAIAFSGGRDALTFWKVLKRFDDLSLVEVEIKTGRTHQIRVHMNSEGFPLVGDELYGYKHPFKHIKNKSNIPFVKEFGKRQMLHSRFLSFEHPVTKKVLSFEAPLFPDMDNLISSLK